VLSHKAKGRGSLELFFVVSLVPELRPFAAVFDAFLLSVFCPFSGFVGLASAFSLFLVLFFCFFESALFLFSSLSPCSLHYCFVCFSFFCLTGSSPDCGSSA
jgi:hypothetical protein